MKECYEQLAGVAAMRIGDAVLKGEAVEAYETWKATGGAPRVVLKSLEEVKQGPQA